MNCINCGQVNEPGLSTCAFCNFPLQASKSPELEKVIHAVPTHVDPPQVFPDFEIPKPVLQQNQSVESPKDHNETRSARYKNEVSNPIVGLASCPQCNYQLIADTTCPMCSFKLKPGKSAGIGLKEASTAAPRNDDFKFDIPKPVLPKKEIPTSAGDSDAKEKPPVSAGALDPVPATKEVSDAKGKATTSPFTNNSRRLKNTNTTIDPFRKETNSEQVTAVLTPLPRDNEKAAEPVSIVFLDAPIPLNRAMLEVGNNTITSKVQAEIEYVNGAWYLIDRSEKETTFVLAKTPVMLQKGDVILMGNRKFRFDG